MQKEDQKPVRVDRRDFIKATTLAGMAGTLSGASLLAQDTPISSKIRNAGKTRKVLFVSDSPSSYEKLIDSIKAIREYEFQVIPIQASLQLKPQEVARSVRELGPRRNDEDGCRHHRAVRYVVPRIAGKKQSATN